MKNIIKGQIVTLFSLLAAFTITLVACGGGGSSSAGGGAGIKTATVSGTVSGGSTAGIRLEAIPGIAGVLAVLGDLVVPAAHADGKAGVAVVVTCDGIDYSGETGADGKFKIKGIPFTGSCTTRFDGNPGPNIEVAEGMETEVEISVGGGSAILLSAEQKPDSTALEIEVEDDGSSDTLADNDSDGDSDSVSDGISDGTSDGVSDSISDGSSDGNS